MDELIKQHSRVGIAPSIKAFLDSARGFMDFHKRELAMTQKELESEKNVIDSLTKANTTIQSSLDKIDEKIKAIGNGSSQVSASYSNMASRPPVFQKHVVLLKATISNLSPAQLKTMICNSLNPSEFDPVGISVNKTNVAVEVSSAKGAKKLIELVKRHEKLKDTVEAYEPNPRCPNVIIRNIDYSTSDSELIETIINRNNLNFEPTHAKILFTIKRKFSYDAVICFSPHAYNALASLQSPIRTGFTGCMFEETVLTGHCSKCLSLSHRTRECTMNRQNKKCQHCLQEFSTIRNGNNDSPFYSHLRNCGPSSSPPKCANCTSHNKHSSNSDHYSLSMECPLFRARHQSVVKLTCYDKTRIVTFRSRADAAMDSEANTLSQAVNDSQISTV